MKRLLAGLALALCLVGCSSGGHIPSNPLPPVPIPWVDPNAGVDLSQDMMWPFMWAGFLGLLAGLAWAVLFKDLKVLMYAGLIALVPPAFYLFLTPFTLYVGLLALASGLVLFCWLCYKIWDNIDDDLYKERQERKEAEKNGKSPVV